MDALCKILVVDDEQGVRDFLSAQLSKRGYEVRCAGNGPEALSAVKTEKFHLVMCDLNMPKMDGLQLITRLKGEDPDLEIILSTGYATVESAVQAMKLGACEVLQKPFDLSQLRTVVDKALEKSRLMAELALYEASRALFSQLKLAELLPLLANLSIKLLGADQAFLLLKSSEGRLRVAASQNCETDLFRSIAVDNGLASRLALCQEPAVIVGPLDRAPRFAGLPSPAGIASSLVCPLLARSEFLGILCASRARPQNFGSTDLRRASIFCQEVALALDNARLYRELEEKIEAAELARRKLEESQAQLVQSEKMAVVGLLAGGVAHEIANPLTIIQGSLFHLHETVKEDPATIDDLRRIEKHTKRIICIVDDLLDYSRPSAFDPQPLVLAEVMEESLGLLGHELLKYHVEVAREYAPNTPQIPADSKRLKQVFLNLMINAVHAMEDAPPRRLTLRTRAGASGAEAEVCDTGKGIAPEHLSKIFSPFFTTKGPGKGTGLGLFIVQGIAKQHHGEIQVDSRPGQGTVFRLILPAGGPK